MSSEAAGGADEHPRVEGRALWCGWCGAGLRPKTGPGRPRRFCKPSCRQAAYVARRLAEAAGLDPEHAVIDRAEYESLMANVVALRQAVDDIRRLEPAPDDALELRQSLDWLMDHASRV